MRPVAPALVLLFACAPLIEADAACHCAVTNTVWRVAMLGDSQTAGNIPGNTKIPSSTLSIALGYPNVAFNYGLGGDKACTAYTARWPDIRASSNHYNVLNQQMGGNDLLIGSGTAEAAYACITSLWDEALADGWRVVAWTIAPFKGYTLEDATKTARRNTLNGYIRAGAASRGIGLVDADALLKDESDPDACQDSPAYCGSDHLHFTDAGWDVLAAAAAAVILN